MFEKIKNILNSQLYAISLYARQIAGTFILFVIAHYLSVYDYGLFSSYKNIAMFALLFANLGYSDYILVSSKANVKEVKLKISLFLFNAIALSILVTILSCCFKLENHFLFFLVILRTFFDGIFFALILPYFQASKNFKTISYINLFYSIALSIIAVISYVFKLSLIKFLLLNICLGLFNFIQCTYYAKINYFLVINYLKRLYQMIDKSIFAYIGVTIAYLLYAQIPSLYVSTYLTKEEAALYFAAFTISNIISLLISAQVQKMIPDMINTSIEQVKFIINRNLKFMIIATSLVFVFMVFAGKLILSLLYGQTYYLKAYPVLLILMLGNICVAEAAVYGTYITASGNQKRKIPMQLKATAVTIISLFLFHKLGVIGASCSFLLAAIYVSYLYTTFTLKFLKQQSENNIKENLCNNN